MGRRRRGRSVDGILVLDKPGGISSNAALQRCKRLFNAAKAGHTGSLDPMATGVLPLCFGEATKFSQFVLEANKGYTATFAIGVATDSHDAEGEVVARANAESVTQADVEAALGHFVGDIDQVPPMYSALKRDGQPLYKLARQGIEVERSARRVTIEDLRCLAFRPGETAEVDVAMLCSKGTYVRSLSVDVGARLGLPAHVKLLRRTQAGPFALADAVTLEQLETTAAVGVEDLDAHLMPMDRPLAHLPAVNLGESSTFYLGRGQPVLVPNGPQSGKVRLYAVGGCFLGIGEMLDDGRVAPRRLVIHP